MESIYTKTIFMAIFVFFLHLLFLAGFAAEASSESLKSPSTELVQLETRPGVELKFLLIKPDNPVAVLILLEGGPGKLPLTTVSGEPTIKRGIGFLVRSREDFARHGFMVVLLDAPSDKTRMAPIIRTSNEYAQDLGAVVSYLNNKTNLPLWFVGMSLGSFSASNGVININEGISGLVLISSVTRSDKRWAVYSSHPNGILSMELDKVKVPALIVAHKEDECPDTPASLAPKIEEALVNSPRSEIDYFSGGEKPKTNPRSPAPPGCQPLTQHGYYGIEEQVITAIATFIKSNRK